MKAWLLALLVGWAQSAEELTRRHSSLPPPLSPTSSPAQDAAAVESAGSGHLSPSLLPPEVRLEHRKTPSGLACRGIRRIGTRGSSCPRRWGATACAAPSFLLGRGSHGKRDGLDLGQYLFVLETDTEYAAESAPMVLRPADLLRRARYRSTTVETHYRTVQLRAWSLRSRAA